jgi:hypothetical protein
VEFFREQVPLSLAAQESELDAFGHGLIREPHSI